MCNQTIIIHLSFMNIHITDSTKYKEVVNTEKDVSKTIEINIHQRC